MTDYVREYFENDRFAKMLGIEIVKMAPGSATTRMNLGPEMLNSFGAAHGGAVFTLADMAFAAAANAHGQHAVGLSTTISYAKSATQGPLTAEAVETSLHPRVGVYNVTVKNPSGETVASFQGVAYRRKDSIQSLLAKAQNKSDA